jgi:hypothetical protein
VQWVQKVCGIQLKGDPIVVQRGDDEDGKALEPVELYFLGTNYRTAQGYHGDVIVDECFWIYGFEELFKVASAMATQKQYTITLFSTPSTLAHEAYPMWNGDRYNKRRAKADRVKLDISHAALAKGMLGADKVWRQIVTIDDAIAAASIWWTRNSCNGVFARNTTTFSAASFSMTAKACSPCPCGDAWWTAGKRGRAITSPMTCARSAMARCGSVTTRTPARAPRRTMPRWWWWPRRQAGGKFRILEKQRLKGLDLKGRPMPSGPWPKL